jgi:hypothetical protein
VREAVIATAGAPVLDSFGRLHHSPAGRAIQAVQITVSIILPSTSATENGQTESGRATRLTPPSHSPCQPGLVVFTIRTRGIGPGLSDQATSDSARWLRYLAPYIWIMGLTGSFKVILDSVASSPFRL